MEVLELLTENEELIGNLYTRYADKFPEFRDYWLTLAVEEAEHAGWIRALDCQQASGTVQVDKNRFKKEAVITYHRYLIDEIGKVNKKELSLQVALTTALYIEESLIEHKYFEVFESDNIVVEKVLTDLTDTTKDHLNRVRRAWFECK